LVFAVLGDLGPFHLMIGNVAVGAAVSGREAASKFAQYRSEQKDLWFCAYPAF
jgi:hypothetical protein